VTVCVPHDQGKGKLCVDDGPKYNSTGGAAKPTAGGLALAEDAASIPVPEAVPTAFGLESNYPNPFNPSTTIRYALPEGADVRLVVYNILGQSVRTLVDGSQSAGRYSVVWDGRDAIGRQVASGLYIYRLQAGSFIATQKMLLAK
jgi:hypothetical protein